MGFDIYTFIISIMFATLWLSVAYLIIAIIYTKPWKVRKVDAKVSIERREERLTVFHRCFYPRDILRFLGIIPRKKFTSASENHPENHPD